jgi:glycosyltransferase involved in cell wall biosynthesis
MKIVVYAHSMEIGGSQLNAIEMGAAVQRLGHEVILVGEQGPLAATASRLGLEHFVIPERRQRPSPSVMRSLANLVRRRGIDVVHGYEWPPALEAWLGPHLLLDTPVVGTVMSAAVAPFLPRTLPLIVGTERLRRICRSDGHQSVTLLEPPVDVQSNAPDFDGAPFRKALAIEPGMLMIVVVCRFARELKLEGLLTACRTFGQLVSEGVPVRLLLVGDGPVRAQVEEEAARANAVAHARAVALTGELQDPRPAYASADIILGMGGSALRGMAFGKPLIVQGERGFWQVCDEDSVGQFLESGWYGLGEGDDGSTRLRAQLLPLLADPERRAQLGRFSRALVADRFSLHRAAHIQLNVYERSVTKSVRPAVREVGRTLAMLSSYKLHRRWERLSDVAAADDFNALRRMRA